MTDTIPSHEAAVRNYYNSKDGEGAGEAYAADMGDVWHHGTYEAHVQGLSHLDGAQAMQQRLMQLAEVRPRDLVLEFGSGHGGGTVNMAMITGATFVGLSNSADLTQRARQVAAERGVSDRVTFRTIGDYDYRTLPARPDHDDELVDAVCFFESVCHLPDKQAFFHAAYRRLKPGGRIVGLDWIQRPFGEIQSQEQIDRIIGPVCKYIRLAGLGTVASYEDMLSTAGFKDIKAVDEWPADQQCWGSTPPEKRQHWLTYTNEQGTGQLFQDAKQALDAARAAGVFSVGWWVATKRGASD